MSFKGVYVDNKPGEYKTDNDIKKIQLLCFDLTNYTVKSQLLLCSLGVFVFFILYGYLQELIFTLDGFRPYGWYLTLIQFGYYTVFGLIECRVKHIVRKISIGTYLLLALLTLGTMGFSNSSLGYLNYPTQVIFKCCKLIPVMVGSILIQGKKYRLLDFLAASLMCIGLILFTLADSMISPRFDFIGVVMISCALLCDAIIGNVQEKAMRQYKGTNTEVVLYSYSIGFLYLLLILLLTGDFVKGVSFCAKVIFNKMHMLITFKTSYENYYRQEFQHPVEVYGYGLLFSLCGYLGIQIVLTLVQCCGAFVAATYLWSGLLVILGIYLNIYSKQGNSKSDLREIWIKLKRCWSNQNRIQRQLMANV
ncbi:adenosine 3'-phospho 5'-phosphosulfate transporter 2 isoform X2 [Cephus cinctus]|uniref:Adenosine 3'-phospho 5'-phosphosulfate transporter 2 n=1 Tax=Cephus cinctus TaxID=211228 RepID=A0AAJ7RUN0_CEPCN|nr:adenosine 3'-phospho 5'-phosphosulfate transporter 2 isoform X2 [Cephus cinctus]